MSSHWWPKGRGIGKYRMKIIDIRNAPNIYPSGIHLEQTAQQTGRERVRRASQCWHACHRISKHHNPVRQDWVYPCYLATDNIW